MAVLPGPVPPHRELTAAGRGLPKRPVIYAESIRQLTRDQSVAGRAADLARPSDDRPGDPARADTSRVHVRADGHRIKIPSSRLEATDLARLAACGAVPARPEPLPPPPGGVIDIERIVSASGNVTVGNHVISAGSPLAGQRVTLRLDGPVAHILANGSLVRTVACPVPQSAQHRLRGARAGTAGPPRLPGPLTSHDGSLSAAP